MSLRNKGAEVIIQVVQTLKRVLGQMIFIGWKKVQQTGCSQPKTVWLKIS
jgi:hypothetical protein